MWSPSVLEVFVRLPSSENFLDVFAPLRPRIRPDKGLHGYHGAVRLSSFCIGSRDLSIPVCKKVPRLRWIHDAGRDERLGTLERTERIRKLTSQEIGSYQPVEQDEVVAEQASSNWIFIDRAVCDVSVSIVVEEVLVCAFEAKLSHRSIFYQAVGHPLHGEVGPESSYIARGDGYREVDGTLPIILADDQPDHSSMRLNDGYTLIRFSGGVLGNRDIVGLNGESRKIHVSRPPKSGGDFVLDLFMTQPERNAGFEVLELLDVPGSLNQTQVRDAYICSEPFDILQKPERVGIVVAVREQNCVGFATMQNIVGIVVGEVASRSIVRKIVLSQDAERHKKGNKRYNNSLLKGSCLLILLAK